MKIILQQDYSHLGCTLDIVEVKDGYARNYLIPQGIAVLATKGNLRHAEEMRKYSSKRAERQRILAQELAEKVSACSCTITVKVKNGEDIYGSVTVQDIVESLARAGLEVSKPSIMLVEPIKKLGVYDIAVKLHKDVMTSLKVWIVKEGAQSSTED